MSALSSFIEGRSHVTFAELKDECIDSGGIWGAPEEVADHHLIEISIHNVTVCDFGPETVAREWFKAAQRSASMGEAA